MFRRGCAFEGVDDASDGFDRGDQCDEQEDQWEGPWIRAEVGLSNSSGHCIEYSDCYDLEEEREQRCPGLVSLVCVLDRIGELGAEFEDYEADDEADHEDYDVCD